MRERVGRERERGWGEGGERERERQRETDRQTDRQTDAKTDKHRTHTHTQTYAHERAPIIMTQTNCEGQRSGTVGVYIYIYKRLSGVTVPSRVSCSVTIPSEGV